MDDPCVPRQASIAASSFRRQYLEVAVCLRHNHISSAAALILKDSYKPQTLRDRMLRILTIVFRCIWAFAIIATAIGIGAAYGWEKHGLVAAIALGFVGLVVSWPCAYSPARCAHV